MGIYWGKSTKRIAFMRGAMYKRQKQNKRTNNDRGIGGRAKERDEHRENR